jgi:uncharacterized protein with GYD domain
MVNYKVALKVPASPSGSGHAYRFSPSPFHRSGHPQCQRHDQASRCLQAGGKVGGGGTLRETYWTLGEYDIVAIADAPDDMVATALSLTLSKAGNVRTQTRRAFSQAEMDAILSKVA